MFCCGLSNAVDYSEEDFRLPLFSLAYISFSFSFSFTATTGLQYIIAVCTTVIKLWSVFKFIPMLQLLSCFGLKIFP